MPSGEHNGPLAETQRCSFTQRPEMKSKFFSIALLVGLSASIHGQAAAPRQDFQNLREQAGAWLEAQALKAHPDAKIQVRVGPVDERLNLPACREPTFFLPHGVEPFGNGSVGARCDGAEKWSLYITFESRARGPALVAKRPMPSRYIPTAGDLELKVLEYRLAPDMYPRELPRGAQLLRPLAPGQPLLLDGLRQPDVIRAGQKVHVTVAGSGFHVSQEGTALGNAAHGQPIKVKIASGRIIQGVATRDGNVEVSP